MINEQTVQQELNQLQSLTVLVETYEAIAGTSMRRIHGSVLANRVFHIGLNQMFREITSVYKKEVEYLMKKKKIAPASSLLLMKHTKKSVFVFLSANTGLYGDVVHRIFTAFLTETKRTKADIIIIGRMGKIFFEEAMPGTAFTYFDFPDNAIDIEGLKKITIALAEYEKVVAFYAVFKNLLSQQVRASIISGAELPTEKLEETSLPFYLFEPSLEEVALFFETEIFASLLEQVFHESRLAKLASRMILLDHAITNIESAVIRMQSSKRRMHHRTVNRHLLDSLSGVAFWG